MMTEVFFVLAFNSGRIWGAFSGEGGADGPSTSVILGRRVALANELNPVLNSVYLCGFDYVII